MGESERHFRDCLNLVLSDLRRTTPQVAWSEVEQWALQLGPEVQRAWQTVRAAAEAARETGTDVPRSAVGWLLGQCCNN